MTETSPPISAILGTVTQSPYAALDPAALAEILYDTNDVSVAHGFARRFHELLPRRRDRITTALAHGDPDAAVDALLSLRVASTMVGARQLQALAGELETDVRNADFVAARRRARTLADAVKRARRALDQYLAKP